MCVLVIIYLNEGQCNAQVAYFTVVGALTQ